jgi:hypothetical protein
MSTSSSLSTAMSNKESLPSGIQALRSFELESGLPIRRNRFEKLVDRLEECAEGNGRVAKCQRCPYLAECIGTFDSICGKVALY